MYSEKSAYNEPMTASPAGLGERLSELENMILQALDRADSIQVRLVGPTPQEIGKDAPGQPGAHASIGRSISAMSILLDRLSNISQTL